MSTSTYATIELEKLHESPWNPRKTFDPASLRELADSMTKIGVLAPLLVRGNATGYEIAAGHRRYRAAKLAGLTSVPVIVRDMDDTAFLEVLVLENDQRVDVHPLEEAAGYQTLMTRAKYDVARIAERVGRSVKYIYDRMKLLSLTKDAQALFFEGKITAGHAILLARLKPADQQRAIAPDAQAAFEHEDLLWDPDDEDHRPSAKADPYAGLKPVSVRELEKWIDEHVRFQAAAADPMLFPETVGVVTAAREQAEKIVPITHNHYIDPEAREGRTFGPRSWKRADGTGKAKRCEHAVIGVIVIGPGRGEAFKVCVNKDKCATHWGREQKEAKARAAGATKTGKTGEERWQIEQRKRKEQEALEEAERARWTKAAPTILEAVAAAVKKAPTKATGLLATIILEAVADRRSGQPDVGRYVPRGTSAEDLVRHAAFTVLASEATDRWSGHERFPKRAKAFGIDVRKILDAAAPVPKPEPTAKPKVKVKPKKKAGKR